MYCGYNSAPEPPLIDIDQSPFQILLYGYSADLAMLFVSCGKESTSTESSQLMPGQTIVRQAEECYGDK
jgi:hypothetical protein